MHHHAQAAYSALWPWLQADGGDAPAAERPNGCHVTCQHPCLLRTLITPLMLLLQLLWQLKVLAVTQSWGQWARR